MGTKQSKRAQQHDCQKWQQTAQKIQNEMEPFFVYYTSVTYIYVRTYISMHACTHTCTCTHNAHCMGDLFLTSRPVSNMVVHGQGSCDSIFIDLIIIYSLHILTAFYVLPYLCTYVCTYMYMYTGEYHTTVVRTCVHVLCCL